MAVVVETTIGDFTVDLYTEERPQTCRNFLKLCKLKYYNWNLFHSVQSNFIAQTGDPTGTGHGGESIYGIVLGETARYYEAEQMPKIKHDRAGLLSLVNCGNNMLGSQFFITLAPQLQSLDGEHCVFGEIAEGIEIILKFNETICDGDHRPYQDIRISHTIILEDPFEDPQGFIIPDRSPEPTKEVLMSDRIGADEVIDDTAGMTTEEIVEMQKNKEAKARATILEIVGDIPDADMAPPENVLFVCKLNPVTNDDDLEIIFSRFGKIVGCEVIRDRQTGDSLQYAFIEFSDRKSCEEAYFKMDNVLIDDRRIHVDFSQSVAKMRWRGKGKGIKYFDDRERENSENDKPRNKNYLENKRKQEDRNSEEIKGKIDWDKRYKGEVSGHRKHERRKEKFKNDSEYSRNGRERSPKREKEKDSNSREDINTNRNGDKNRYRSKDQSKDRNRDRSRNKSEKTNWKDNHSNKEHKHSRKQEDERKRRDNDSYSSESENEKHRRREQHSSHKKKHTRDRSEKRHSRKKEHK